MNSFRPLVLLAASFFATTSGQARSFFNYDYVEAGFATTDAEIYGAGIEGDTNEIIGSFDVSNSVNILIGHQSSDYDFDIQTTFDSVGVGFHAPIAHDTDIQLRILYLKAEVDYSADIPITDIAIADIDETGHSL